LLDQLGGGSRSEISWDSMGDSRGPSVSCCGGGSGGSTDDTVFVARGNKRTFNGAGLVSQLGERVDEFVDTYDEWSFRDAIRTDGESVPVEKKQKCVVGEGTREDPIVIEEEDEDGEIFEIADDEQTQKIEDDEELFRQPWWGESEARKNSNAGEELVFSFASAMKKYFPEF